MYSKDRSKVNPEFKSVPLQIYFAIAGLASAVKWGKIQNIVVEECFLKLAFTLLKSLYAWVTEAVQKWEKK